MLSLSEHGKALLPALRETWEDIAQCFSQILGAQDHHLLASITEMEHAFAEQTMATRVREWRNQRLLDRIQIVDYRPEWGSYFKAFNYAWIQRYFSVEPIDIEVLEQHEEKIIGEGGAILFARMEEEIVGTCALKWTEPGLYELTKMAVSESVRGQQVGKKLGLAILARAREMGAERVFLESNRKLLPAIRLYHRLGFVEASSGSRAGSEYHRSDIRMEIKLAAAD